MKVALVYDRVNKWGGAERVLLALLNIFPNATLFTSVYDGKKAPWAKVFKEIKTSFLQNIPLAKKYHEFFPVLMPIAFESFSFDNFDLVISLTSEAAKGVITRPPTHHICICLTPTRYLWSGYHEYFSNPVIRFFSYPAVWYLRVWDSVASRRPDKIIAISTNVKKRIERYYSLASVVINPPLMLDGKVQKNAKKIPGNFFLVVSRLVAYKRVDLAIKACNTLGLNLKIVGSGSEEKKLKSMAGSTIEFVGQVTDIELFSYYFSCKALIFPGREDFGLTMVEAQSFGKPVIAYGAGGALDIIIKGETGEFFDAKTPSSLVKVLKNFAPHRYNRESCVRNAERFSYKEFKKKLLNFLETV